MEQLGPRHVPRTTRAAFDLIRQRAAEAVRVDISKVVVTAESRQPEEELMPGHGSRVSSAIQGV